MFDTDDTLGWVSLTACQRHVPFWPWVPYQRGRPWSRTQTAAGTEPEDSREKRQQGEQSRREDFLQSRASPSNRLFLSFMSLALQLEVVALLFSDVLLMTKVHKKGERLKVVRPPLALDRTHCIALKDGCGSHFRTFSMKKKNQIKNWKGRWADCMLFFYRLIYSDRGRWASKCHECLHICHQHLWELPHMGHHNPES